MIIFLRTAIFNPNPPCGEYFDAIEGLGCITSCEEGDFECIVGCIASAGKFSDGIEKALGCIARDGHCYENRGGAAELADCVSSCPLLDFECYVGCTLVLDPTPFKAIHRPGIGCTLVDGLTEEALRSQELGNVLSPPERNDSLVIPVF